MRAGHLRLDAVTERELALRRRIMESFAQTGAPPRVDDAATLRALAGRHVVVLDESGEILMAHPFAAHRAGTRVTAQGRSWWGNCAWDAYGIAAALDLRDFAIEPDGELFHIAVRAREWWADIGFT
jgi:Alkylmercury lyase